MSFMKDFDHLKIEMKDIILATNNFDPTKVIGKGGFGKVYKGELSLPNNQKITLAFKHLDRRFGQGNTEFWREIMMLSKYKHPNLISLERFCIEGKEMVLAYEYASRGSLDRYLTDLSLTWTQRLTICLGVACGLQSLHDPKETQQRVIHRDIKSSNILLDENWTAKISDFGLSKLGPANQPHTYVVSNAVGTPGYCDPLYWELGFLSKESDVYSFGVVLFEVLCGRLCCEYRNGELVNILVPKWKRCYDEKRLDEIILVGLKDQMDQGSLDSFAAIADRCVKRGREERPVMADVVKELEFSLEQQEILESIGKKVDFEELMRIADRAVPSLSSGPQSQLLKFFLKGFFIDDSQTWISINMKGEITKVVSATKCFFGDKLETKSVDNAPIENTQIVRGKFPNYLWNVYSNRFKVEVNTELLTPDITYTVYIVFGHCGYFNSPSYIPFEYKVDTEEHYATSCIAYRKETPWVMTKLYQFTSYRGQENFGIEFYPREQTSILDRFAFEGIEFRPMENETCEKQEELHMLETDLETRLETDFKDIIEMSKDIIQWESKKELYFSLRKGFLIENGHKWFSITKNMKRRLMIPASAVLDTEEWTCNSIPESESRFKVVTKSLINRYWFTINLNVVQMVLPQQTYSCHLIYKLCDEFSSFDGPIVVGIIDCNISLVVPLSICLNTHCYTLGDKDDRITPRKMKGHAKKRKDGWMEVQFAETSMEAQFAETSMEAQFKLSVEEEKYRNMNFFCIVVEGVEFRPL